MQDNKRKGYKTLEQQYQATKRYLDNNPEAKEKRKKYVARSQSKKFINEMATLEELTELQDLINSRIKELKGDN